MSRLYARMGQEPIINFITIRTVMEKLNVRRDYIYKRILPEVGHIKRGLYTYIDEDSLRLWLKKSASFSRQTIWVKNEDCAAHQKKLPSELRFKKLDELLSYSTKRSFLPYRNVKPFDFWDKELIHPAFVVPKDYSNEEMLYREMFLSGAIKITLGRKKTMFYKEQTSVEGCTLMPALGHKAEEKEIGSLVSRSGGKIVNITVPNCPSDEDAEAIALFLKQHQITISEFLYDRKKKSLYLDFILSLEESAD